MLSTFKSSSKYIYKELNRFKLREYRNQEANWNYKFKKRICIFVCNKKSNNEENKNSYSLK